MKTTYMPLVGVYTKHPINSGHYDLKCPKEFPFPYLVFSESKADYLKKVGASVVVNCWNEKIKVLHSGLIEIDISKEDEVWYLGDNIFNEANSKDFILIRYFPDKRELIFYLFQDYYPRRPTQFAKSFILRTLQQEKAALNKRFIP